MQKFLSSLKTIGVAILSFGWLVALYQSLQKQGLLAKLFKAEAKEIHTEAVDETKKKLDGMSDSDIIDLAISKGAEKSKSETGEGS